MPPRVPLARNPVARLREQSALRNIPLCASCSLWRLDALAPRKASTPAARAFHTRTRPSQLSHRRSTQSTEHDQKAYATTLASRTAINPPSNVPTANRDLYASLEQLKDVASDYVNQSRLQLALRGLETERPIVRIGLLGLGREGDKAARKLARVLLADALSEEGQWERILAAAHGDGGKALLLKLVPREDSMRGRILTQCRYGAEDDMEPFNPLVETMNVPSRILQRHNLEILITSLNTNAGPTGAGADPAGLVEAILVPPLQTPVASTGRAGFVRYPVHKAIVIGEGIEGCMEFGRLSGAVNSTSLGRTGTKEDLIHVTLSMPHSDVQSANDSRSTISSVDIDQAGAALDLFRQDVANGPAFNAQWQASNMPTLTRWIASEADGESASSLRPALQHHIRSTLNSTTAAIRLSEATARSSLATYTIPDETRITLQTAISAWSQHAHTDLQLSLATALASRSWRRTSWTRLLWRVDDVAVSGEDVLRSHWLLDAEAGLAFLAGRVEQAGFFRSSSAHANFNPDYALHQSDRAVDKTGDAVAGERAYLTAPTDLTRKAGFRDFFTKKVRAPTPAELLKTDKVLAGIKEQGGIDILHSRPWPLAIHFTRQKLLHTLVPALQSRAQTLLVTSLSTIGATGALGAWIFAATGGTGIYEAGAVAALGLVWSLRRLQRKWEDERRVWESEVREQGRLVLAEVEGVMRNIVRENEKPALRLDDIKGWQKAAEAVSAVEMEMGKTAV